MSSAASALTVETSPQKTISLANIVEKILSIFSLIMVLAIGGFLCRNIVTSMLALGYMVVAMRNVIHNDGKIMTALPGQKALCNVPMIALLFLPSIIVVQTAPLVGIVLFVAAVFYTIVGCAALSSGASRICLIKISAAIEHLRNQNPQSHWMRNLFSAYYTSCKSQLANLGNMWMLGAKAFLGAYLWLVVPSFFLAIGWYFGWIFSFERLTYEMSFCVLMTVLGVFSFGWVAIHLPLSTAHFAMHGNIKSFFDISFVKKHIRKAPLSYGLVLLFTIFLTIFPYAAKIPRLQVKDVAGVAFLFFVLVLWAKLLWAKVYAIANSGEEKNWYSINRWLLRVAKVASFILVPIILLLSQFVSWRGAYGFFDHFMYLLPTFF
ncbi:hypothetical protein [Candidatus Uabimicrobium amorphum]|uniref:DUF4013 domain-containing protein n=1 Tax=Uabimicrobium amorphum TaxID=2596890 RepID=A0A5S9F5P4_UABAM|nr:hypothetical protein [Candidatus Uabimicrobium amorphum]BBM85482.1 hypothetical protein UABAM_03851 [Candidatus Uabimicrobium amorphum]